MKIGIAGDWHGNFTWTKHVLACFKRNGITTVHQVGDFGIAWPGHGQAYTDSVDALCELLGITLYITPGNHENWDWIDGLPFQDGQAWIGMNVCILERGFRFEMGGRSFLSLGGAPSIDFDRRQEGVSWWRGEALTEQDVAKVAYGGSVEIMLAHDAPDGGTDKVQRIIDRPGTFWSEAGLQYAKEGRELMTAAFEAADPIFFAHGHYHVHDEKKVGECQFVSLGTDGKDMNAIVLDLDSLEFSWLPTWA